MSDSLSMNSAARSYLLASLNCSLFLYVLLREHLLHFFETHWQRYQRSHRRHWAPKSRHLARA
ncbi:hypothetical protein HYPSUDRAFT_815666 [Hypholoma sublateritium FD-334 SS-4]|uniref:Uncharacterized protein n=1 Tax=Hypholoma sublateritium (strain FD-334 SS-4) TaxID=945553 RepID=A0A0D2MAT7_HYPSF|nr:hypothetical protein HYPSUDRAFT_815666 [Hypholoma sublateritium FD-334 SS-4]